MNSESYAEVESIEGVEDMSSESQREFVQRERVLAQSRNGLASDSVRVYCDGVFDLFHYGHVRALAQAKMLFPSVHLIVGVCSDSTVLMNKGPTVMSMMERAFMVEHCVYTNEVVLDAPWHVSGEFLSKHRVDYVVHDGQVYLDKFGQDMYAEAKALGKYISLKRTENISSTDISVRILRHYPQFVLRNIGRGVDPKDMNCSWLYASLCP